MSYKFYEETRFKESEVGPIPKDWQVGRLGEVSTISSGGSAPQGDFYFGGKNYFIRVSHIDNQTNTIKTFDLITDEAVKKYKLKLYQKGTIVFPKSGATVYLEKRAQLPFDAYIVSHLCAVHSNSKNLDQKFLYFVLLKSKFAEKKGDGYPTLNLSEIKQIPIPLPPLSEQKAIAEILQTIDDKIQKEEARKQAIENLFKSMLSKLMSGELRVHRVESYGQATQA
ncbi:MAG: restriction endonuclease subunit S [Candidatus Anstonellales archaeon]